MRLISRKVLRGWGWMVVLVLVAGAAFRAAAMVDLNGNGISDIWEWIYGAPGINPNADSDGDGFSNLQEAIAGTNPFDSNSYPKISLVTVVSGTNVNVTIPGTLGKLYQLKSTTNLGSSNWLVETGLVLRTGTNVRLPSAADSTAKFSASSFPTPTPTGVC